MPEPNHQYLAELVTRSKQRDADAFAELYALTYNKTYNYAWHYLKDGHLAQDAVQEIYISAFCKIGMLSDPTLFVAWLNRISFHVCYDIRQKQYGHQDFPGPELLELIADEHPRSNPEALALHRDELKILRQALEELPLQERTVLIMRYYNDMKLEDIACATGLSPSTVKRYIASAKRRLARKLRQ